MKKAIVAVTNDLATDQRVDKACKTLCGMGFEVCLVGRKLKSSMPLAQRPYKTHRMRLFFTKGPGFYAEFNIRLFLYLLFHRSDLLVSNDLDTLLATYLSRRIKGNDLVYDSHEYYTETPELVSRPKVQQIWEGIEKRIFPKLKDVITVNRSIAQMYEKKYGLSLHVVRNIPPLRNITNLKNRAELGLPADKKIVLLQGAGINIQRGAEEAVEAMQYVDDAILLIIGGGDVIDILKENVQQLQLQENVRFFPKQPFEKLYNYTVLADLGLSLDKDTNLNYRFSLPNKLFDYIHAGVPVLASPMVEIKKIILDHGVGDLIETHDPQHIAAKINEMLNNTEKRAIWKANIQKARHELCWQNEEKNLIRVYEKYAG